MRPRRYWRMRYVATCSGQSLANTTRSHGSLDRVADAAQDGAQRRHAVAGEDDDAGAAHAAPSLRADQGDDALRGLGDRRRELLAERLHVFGLDREDDDLLGHVVAELVPELQRRVQADRVGGAVAVPALEVLGLVAEDLAGPASASAGLLSASIMMTRVKPRTSSSKRSPATSLCMTSTPSGSGDSRSRSATSSPTPSSDRIGLPMPRTSVELTSHVPLDAGDDVAGGLAPHRDLERHLAGQRVRGAAEARVVGAEGHLDHVEDPFADLLAAGR